MITLVAPSKDFDESLHPRDDHGRFAETEGGGDITTGTPSSHPEGRDPRLIKNLDGFARHYASAKLEHLNGYDKDGNLIEAALGTKDKVSFSKEGTARLFNCEVLIHNHPADAAKREIGGSFSKQDIIGGAYVRAREERVVDDKYVYVMRPTEWIETPATTLTFDGKEIELEAQRAAKWPDKDRLTEVWDKAYKQANAELVSDIHAGNKTLPEAQGELDHRIWTYAAPKLGLEYERHAHGS